MSDHGTAAKPAVYPLTNVRIVRDDMPPRTAWITLFSRLVSWFLVPWIAMLCIGAADIGWSPSYWQTWFLATAGYVLWPGDHSYRLFTTARKDLR